MDTKNVIIYSTPSCHYCQKAKDLFTQYGVTYTEHNVVIEHDKRTEMIQKSGQLGVPVILIGDQMILGFDKEAIMKSLNIKEKDEWDLGTSGGSFEECESCSA